MPNASPGSPSSRAGPRPPSSATPSRATSDPLLGDRNFAMFDAGTGDGRSVADIPEEELYEGFGE